LSDGSPGTEHGGGVVAVVVAVDGSHVDIVSRTGKRLALTAATTTMRVPTCKPNQSISTFRLKLGQPINLLRLFYPPEDEDISVRKSNLIL